MGVCRWFVVNPTITVRFSEDELRKLDELAQRMNKTRSDVIRDLINRFDEALKQEVERESKKWLAIGFVSALESAILSPEVIVRFVRRNVDILGYPDFIIGMVRFRNRVVVFSHQDRIGHQLLQLVRSKIEEEIRREEMEMEQEDGEDEEDNVGRSVPAYVRVSGPVRPGTTRAAPVTTRYRLVSSNRAAQPAAKSTAASTVSKPVNNDGGGAAKAAVATSMPGNQKLAVASPPISTNPADSQPRDSGPQVSAGGGGANSVRPVGGVSMERLGGDFAFALITNLYHKHRDALLRAVETVMGG
jgi:hypothetical protein